MIAFKVVGLLPDVLIKAGYQDTTKSSNRNSPRSLPFHVSAIFPKQTKIGGSQVKTTYLVHCYQGVVTLPVTFDVTENFDVLTNMNDLNTRFDLTTQRR